MWYTKYIYYADRLVSITIVFWIFRIEVLKLFLVFVLSAGGDRKGRTANRSGDSWAGACRKGEGEGV